MEYLPNCVFQLYIYVADDQLKTDDNHIVQLLFFFLKIIILYT